MTARKAAFVLVRVFFYNDVYLQFFFLSLTLIANIVANLAMCAVDD